MVNFYALHKKQYPTHALYLCCLIAVLIIKLFYRTADSSSLQFILAPVTKLVEVFTGTHYQFVPERGYLSSDLTVEIGPGCAGINFLVISFCTFVFSFIKQIRSTLNKIIAASSFLIFSYIITIIVNTFRIVTAINFSGYNDTYMGLDKEFFHKIVGSLVYFFFLVLCYIAVSKLMTFITTRNSIEGMNQNEKYT
ncbi:exosortase K [Pseudobacteroides cellulosolvens]|uniref:Exosortase/Archaeosortase domain containing protein n=1 Tax=Pseudobacteroides cellulosolvens ATCC 35603 = DSM 2933 TaxID=398512 RepID=A0A0L6JPC7_9FIRM|nr:exosortase K [Pseudobacteroides cellulosolvens]KNY27202.1 Exosortase/Archaeosortase domain containing protein [Pseudobacteroides cellulosolvens ATCC 35603 = DSM 2933]